MKQVLGKTTGVTVHVRYEVGQDQRRQSIGPTRPAMLRHEYSLSLQPCSVQTHKLQLQTCHNKYNTVCVCVCCWCDCGFTVCVQISVCRNLLKKPVYTAVQIFFSKTFLMLIKAAFIFFFIIILQNIISI